MYYVPLLRTHLHHMLMFPFFTGRTMLSKIALPPCQKSAARIANLQSGRACQLTQTCPSLSSQQHLIRTRMPC